MTNFWTGKVAPAMPDHAPASGAQYRADRAHLSGVYSDGWVNPQARPVQPGSIPAAMAAERDRYHGLESYQSREVRSRWLPQAGQSPMSYIRKLNSYMRGALADELPEDEYAEVVAAWNEAHEAVEKGESFDQLRERLDSKQDGSGIGVMGNTRERSAIATELRNRQQADIDARFGGLHEAELSAGTVSGISINVMSRRAQDNNVAVVRPTMIG